MEEWRSGGEGRGERIQPKNEMRSKRMSLFTKILWNMSEQKIKE